MIKNVQEVRLEEKSKIVIIRTVIILHVRPARSPGTFAWHVRMACSHCTLSTSRRIIDKQGGVTVQAVRLQPAGYFVPHRPQATDITSITQRSFRFFSRKEGVAFSQLRGET
ncbi:MAG: hypothetical protein D3914_16655 [Candidatus Electrothrix sp. LOE2]|nr:hypothetical protein [Candidatus Electrothrix sp. LOE2]